MLKALTLSGSIRKGSFNTLLADVMATKLEARGADVTRLSLADYPMPLFNEDLESEDGVPQTAFALADKFLGADIIFIASPEYNNSITPLTKNTIDWLSRTKKRAFSHAVFGLGAASSGKLSGVMSLSHLRDILAKINATYTPTGVWVGPSDTAFTADRSDFADERDRKRADLLLDELFKLAGK